MRQCIWNAVSKASSIGICGHVRPDGDCVGSCMAMYLYIKKLYPEKKVYVYFEQIPESFMYLNGIHEAITDYKDYNVDTFISLDCSDSERLGEARALFEKAATKINIDHHISNISFGDINHFEPESSSTCEVVFELFDEERIDKDIAMCLYTGMIHDTGVFSYSNTSKRTMEIGGKLIAKGIDHSKIINESFYESSLENNRILGRCLLDSKLLFDNKLIYFVITKDIFDEYKATPADTEGVVSKLLLTKGAEVSLLVYQLDENEYKASLRSKSYVDVSKIALKYGGGGHIKASGCTLTGDLDKKFAMLLDDIKNAL